MVVQHNMSALFSSGQIGRTQRALGKSTEKLSSGYAINRAADNAASLSISENMRRQIRGLNRGAQNVQDGISFTQVADGALSEVNDMLQRMNELCIQAANGTNSPLDRIAINQEIAQIKAEIQRTFSGTEFNSRPIWTTDTNVRVKVPNEYQQVLILDKNTPLQLSNANSGIVPKDFTFNTDIIKKIDPADPDAGQKKYIEITWKGHDDQDYSYTKKFDDYLKDYTIDLTSAGLTGFSFHHDVASDAKAEDVEDCFKKASFSLGNQINFNVGYSSSSSAISGSTSLYLDYDLLYESKVANKFSFDTNNNTAVLKPSTTSLGADGKIKYTFSLEGVAKDIEVTMKSMSYSASSYNTANPSPWWHYYRDYNNVQRDTFNTYYPSADKTGFEDALTGDDTDIKTPGLLNAPTGANSGGGIISTGWKVTHNGNEVGSIGNVKFTISGSDSLTTAMAKFDAAAAAKYNTGTNGTRLYLGDMRLGQDMPVYESKKGLLIHSGPSVDDEINIIYNSLSTANIGIRSIDVLTEDNAKNAIGKVAKAIEKISSERANFGAYQNRLEHTFDNDKNIEENLQAAESRIRDTDMSDEIVKLSTSKILAQTGQSMLSQSNTSMEQVLALLQ